MLDEFYLELLIEGGRLVGVEFVGHHEIEPAMWAMWAMWTMRTMWTMWTMCDSTCDGHDTHAAHAWEALPVLCHQRVVVHHWPEVRWQYRLLLLQQRLLPLEQRQPLLGRLAGCFPLHIMPELLLSIRRLLASHFSLSFG